MSQHHILIIDSNRNTRLSLSQIFQADGYLVTTASNQQQAAVHLSTNPPDLIIANIPQSDRSGFAVLVYLKQVFPHIPVLVLSASALDETALMLTVHGLPKEKEHSGYSRDLLDRIGLALAI